MYLSYNHLGVQLWAAAYPPPPPPQPVSPFLHSYAFSHSYAYQHAMSASTAPSELSDLHCKWLKVRVMQVYVCVSGHVTMVCTCSC